MMGDRVAAGIAFVTAVALMALSVMLISISAGQGAPTGLLAASGMVAELGILAVMLVAFARVRSGGWTWLGRALALVGVILLLAGDATQTNGLRQVGNLALYAAMLQLGLLLWAAHPKLAAFIAVNGLLGIAFVAIGPRLGLPDGLNLIGIVAWLVALGLDWLRAPWSSTPAARGPGVEHATSQVG